MHGHGSARAERVHSDVFWGKAECGRSHPQALGPINLTQNYLISMLSIYLAPVKAGIYIFLRLRDQGCDPTTPISDYPSDHCFPSVSASNIIAIIRAECLRV